MRYPDCCNTLSVSFCEVMAECYNSDDVPLYMPHTAHWTVRSARNMFNCAVAFP